MSYYDVDTILADSLKIPCTFELEIPGLGFLDGNAGGNVKSGSRIDLPLWLAEMLAVGPRSGADPIVMLDLPPALSDAVLNALKADPRTVDLRAQASHFYKLAVRILMLMEEEEGMTDLLIDTLKKRAAQIADQAHNSRGASGEGAEFLRGLDETERQLYKAAHDSSRAMRIWAGELKQ